VKTIVSSLIASLLVMGSVLAEAAEPYLIPLAPNHVGYTTKMYPSICWMLSKRLPAAERIIFILRDDRSIKPYREVELPRSILNGKQGTCHCVNLKEYDIQLEANVEYKWFIAIIQSSESGSRHIVAGGKIERCEPEECLVQQTFHGCDRDEVISLARAGLWYDSPSCLCDLIKLNPDDDKLRRLLNRLLKDTGIILLNE